VFMHFLVTVDKDESLEATELRFTQMQKIFRHLLVVLGKVGLQHRA